MWAKEDPPGEETAEDVWFQQYFHNTHRRDHTGRYIVNIPMRPGWQSLLGESRRMAERRFFQLEARFERLPEFRDNYIKFMNEYEQLNHMRLVPPHELKPADGVVNYIPHHALPPPRKFRVVFDASATTSTGKSFNELQYSGARIFDDLDILIMRFRGGRYAMSADICKMFRQIRVAEAQYNLQRILWRPAKNQPLREYQLTVTTYGTASAPALAEHALNQCAEDNKEEYPLAAETVQRNFYVDDCLRSDNNRDQLQNTKQQLIEMLRRGGFELAKWASNIDQSKTPSTEPVAIGDDLVGLLGLYWAPSEDIFKFKRIPTHDNRPITKRTIVSQVAKLYDPIGFVGPIVIHMRSFIQQLWKLKIKWDDEVEVQLKQQWMQMQNSLPSLGEIKIPRWLGHQEAVHQTIHVFSDASRKAFGAVAYMRSELPNGGTRCQLIMSKAYVAGTKGLTIPRLELKAAVTSARLIERIRRALDIPLRNIYCWTDSEVVLYWIRRPSTRAKVFVATRVAEVQSATDVTNWYHVTTKENPADVLSRGTTVHDLVKHPIWWNGPRFLQGDFTTKFVDHRHTPETIEQEAAKEYQAEEVRVQVNAVFLGEMQLIDKYSSLEKALRITSYVLRFITNCRELRTVGVHAVETRAARRAAAAARRSTDVTPQVTPAAESHDDACMSSSAGSTLKDSLERPPLTADVSAVLPPTPNEREEALKVWLRAAQRDAYMQEYTTLQLGKPLARTSRLLELTPYIDDNGLMRARGRLAESSLSFDQKYPIILPPKSTVAQRLIRLAHLSTLHGGVQLTMHKLREHYWITRLRQAVKPYIRRCLTCLRHNATMAEQLMADLPRNRVQAARPFSKCGVDFAGPIRVKAWEGRTAPVCSKAYIAIFVCFIIKAVHLELVSDLTTDAFLKALDRMMARKGKVDEMSSDNGKTLVGANNQLKLNLEQWQAICNDLKEELAARRIEWKFITPLSPHHGGLWEAAVKSTKYHLVRAIGSAVYTHEQMNTLLARIEACLNSRPLTPLSDDPNDLTALTPAHLLGITPAMSLLSDTTKPSGDFDGSIDGLTQTVWQRWHTEYLSSLNHRGKWRQQQENLKEGDLIILKEDHTPPATWPLGRIVTTHPGPDGLVRSVTVRTRGRIYKRPIVKCCKLPTDEPAATHQAAAGFPSESAA